MIGRVHGPGGRRFLAGLLKSFSNQRASDVAKDMMHKPNQTPMASSLTSAVIPNLSVWSSSRSRGSREEEGAVGAEEDVVVQFAPGVAVVVWLGRGGGNGW